MTYQSSKAHRPADWHPWRNSGLVRVAEGSRVCGDCQRTYAIGQFPVAGSGRRTICRWCHNARRRAVESQPEFRARKRERDRDWYHRNAQVKIRANLRLRHKRLAREGKPVPVVPSGWYDVTRASIESDRSATWVRSACQRGVLRAVKEVVPTHGGRCWRIDPESVKRFKYTGDGR